MRRAKLCDTMPNDIQTALELADFIEASPTPFHAVSELAARLTAAGFTELGEGAAWKLEPGGRYHVIRNGSSLMAFVVADRPPAETGFRLTGAHSDSPNLRLKPRPETLVHGYRQLAVEVYGGVLLSTWLDRDLGLGGRVFAKGERAPRLVRSSGPICRIPNLAIHLDRTVNEEGLKLNAQTHLPPVIGLSDAEDTTWLRGWLARELSLEPGAIQSFDLMLHDTQKPAVSGLDSEFLHAPRLDNLASCHASLAALSRALAAGRLPATSGFVVYDHEEVGSETASGAASNLLESVLERIVMARGGGREEFRRAVARSLFVSADMAHALHPNRADRHEPGHAPKLNAGPVIKMNANQRYATDAATGARFLELAAEVEVPTQVFVTRSDLPCGSTIGPITATRLGIPTVDVGNPMLSMHSCREMAGTRDPELMVRVLARLFAS